MTDYKKQVKIPKYEWPEFIFNFSVKNRKRPVSIKHEDKGGTPILETESLPLKDIELVENGVTNLVIKAGDGPDEKVLHKISDPLELYLWHKKDGDEGTFLIINANGEKSTFVF